MKTVKSLQQFQELPDDQKPYWYIPENICQEIMVSDNEESLESIRAVFQKNNQPIILASVSPEPYTELALRTNVIKKLLQATQFLQERTAGDVILKITDAFRPLILQRQYFTTIKEEIAQKEQLAGQELWNRVTQFIADPDLNPPHSTGGTVDLTLYSQAAASELDMGTAVDTIDDSANTWYETISPKAKTNRQLLFDAMTTAGFINLPTEWWHYSFGDQYWAAYTNQPHTLFGTIEEYRAK